MLRWLAAVALALGISAEGSAAPCAGFTDVDDTDAFCPSVTWIKNRNVTFGCAASLYCPNDPVTRLSMAAFLNRLGDLVLPPNVIWVAPVGGQFQAIQTAIDYAVSLPPGVRRLIKLAPGTYNGAIAMAPGVDIEGSGESASVINATVCSTGTPTSGTVTGASGAQLRNVTVSATGPSTGSQCAAVYLDVVNGTALRNVRVTYGITGTSLVYGVLIASTTSTSYALMLDNVAIDSLDLGNESIGISATGAPSASMLFRDVRFTHAANLNRAGAFRLIDAAASIDRASVFIAQGTSPPSPPGSLALLIDGSSVVTVERSSLRVPGGAYANLGTPAATLRIANTLLDGTLLGAASCVYNYGPTFAPVTC